MFKKNKQFSKDISNWATGHLFGLFLFNTILVILVLLNTAQYFKPFFYLGINSIFFISLLLSIVLLGAHSRTMFLISIIFFVFGLVLKLVKIDIWADRASIYFYQSTVIGVILLLRKSD